MIIRSVVSGSSKVGKESVCFSPRFICIATPHSRVLWYVYASMPFVFHCVFGLHSLLRHLSLIFAAFHFVPLSFVQGFESIWKVSSSTYPELLRY
uniref:Uncharacterized protein n=1 Tax=Cucumis melo TaxID=3656 RepID=A0A9I9EJB5_CUCME